MTPRFPPSLVDAAAFERDRRAESYPPLVAARPAEGEQLNADFQAWCAIAEWLATGRSDIIGNWGGIADPPVTVIDWPFLEARAAAALDSLKGMVAKAEAEPKTTPAEIDALRARADRVFCIHAIVQRRRESLDRTNRMIRESLSERSAAA